MADYDMAAPDVANGAGNGDRSPSGDRAAPSGDRSPIPAREGSETGSRRATGNYERERSDRPRDRSRSRSPYSRGGGSGSYSRRDDRDRSPRRGRPPPPPPGRNAEAPPSNVLGCFGLSIRTRDIDLEDEFSRYGQVEKAVIVYDQRSERSRGFGFVTMREQEDAARCIEKLNGIELHGRNIRVAYSMTTKPHQSTPGEYMGFKTDDRDGDRSYRRDDRGPRRDYDDRPPRRDYDDRRGGYDDRRGGGYDDRRGGGYGGGRRDYDDRRAPLPSPRDYDDDRAPRRSRDDSPPRRRSPIPPPRE